MRRKLTIAIGIVLVLAALGVFTARGWLAERAFERAVERNVGVDRSLALGDGLHAYLCGSGSPMADADRAGPCIAVLAGGRGFVFDSGSGSVRKLLRMGFPIERLDAVFLTHLHSDHIDGLGELMLQAWVGGSRSTPLPVYGPQGAEAVVDGLMKAYAADRGYRIAHHGPAVARPGGFGGEVHRLPDGPGGRIVYRKGGVAVRALAVNHEPVSPAYAYRIDYKGRSVTISGDTAYSADLARMAKGADVLFHEALNRGMVRAMEVQLERRGRADAARIMGDIPGYHASPAEAARTAEEAGVKALVLYHLVPPIPPGVVEPAFLGDASDRFSGELRVGSDGLLVSLPANGARIDFYEAL